MIGHEQNRQFFFEAYQSDRLSHAYILSGPSGIGKKLFALNFAKGLLCEKGSFFERCTCSSCKQVDMQSHPDFYLLDSKDSIKIDGIRSLIAETAGYTSYMGGWKVVVIDKAHNLSSGMAESANALLKTLEEPGEKTLFLLITENPSMLLDTIRSRCATIEFNPLNDDELKEVLYSIDSSIDWSRVIPYARGSVENALTAAELQLDKLVINITSGDYDALAFQLLSINSKDHFAMVLKLLKSFFIDEYKMTGDIKPAALVEYINELEASVNYNINLNLNLMDLYIKLVNTLKG